ncbi:MAG: recombination mediator RecR [Clostridia bacterium]|nr:recombination mediator RecR [Clostridia bacterium]
MQSEVIDKLIASFRKLPGIGAKTAKRYAYSIIENDYDNAKEFAQAIIDVKDKIKFCKTCGNYCEDDYCEFCQTRKSKIICVVQWPKDIESFEKIPSFNCLYHVLHGLIDFQKGVTPDDLKIDMLVDRVKNGDIEEVILATDTTPGGEMTKRYIYKALSPLGVKITTLATGISLGSEIEFADEITLEMALKNRKAQD